MSGRLGAIVKALSLVFVYLVDFTLMQCHLPVGDEQFQLCESEKCENDLKIILFIITNWLDCIYNLQYVALLWFWVKLCSLVEYSLKIFVSYVKCKHQISSCYLWQGQTRFCIVVVAVGVIVTSRLEVTSSSFSLLRVRVMTQTLATIVTGTGKK